MKRTDKKGFTIVELVIVIAVIAILAAVLIPNISKLVRKANESSDLSLVRNLNTALTVENKDYATAHEAFEAVKEAGYDLTKIEAKADKNKILYDSVNKCFVYQKGNDLEYYPNSYKTKLTPNDYYKLWSIETVAKENGEYTYSVYWNGEENKELTVTGVGFDAGSKSVTKVSYNGKNAARNITIRTKGMTAVEINGYVSTSDAKDGDVIYHYGEAGDVTVTKCASASYHVFGEVKGTVTVKEGHVAVEAGATVAQPIVVKNTTGAVKVSAKEVVTVVVDSAVTSNVAIESEKTVYVDDRTNGGKVSKSTNAVAAIGLASESDIGDNSVVDSDGNYALKSGMYKLTANITAAHQIYIKEDATVVLDLNGCTLESQYKGYGFYNEGALIINDTVGTGAIFNSSKETMYLESIKGYYGHDAIRNFGMLTINGGTFGDMTPADKTDTNDSNYGAAVRNQAGGTCIINGGSFTCVDNYGWFDGKTNQEYYKSYSYAIRNYGDMTINNATVYGKMNGGVAADGGTITIYGGDYSVSAGNNTCHTLTRDAKNKGEFYIYGGTFKNEGSATTACVLSVFQGQPSWSVEEVPESSGYHIYGGTYINHGVEKKFEKN